MAVKEHQQIGFAVLGCGHIGLKHIAEINKHPDCQLLAVSDVAMGDFLDIDHQKIPNFKSLSDLLASDLGIDVVCVCTPNSLHAEQCISILKAGKHVVCEKPMGLTKESCEQVIFQALNSAKQVFCVMQNRYAPISQWLKKLVDEQLLGDIFMVQVNCFWNRDDRYYLPNKAAHAWHGQKALDGGTLFTQFSHFVDMLYWLFGDISDIDARLANFNHQHSIDFEDSGIVNFRLLQGKAMGTITYSTAVWDKNMESSFSIIGSKGSVKVGGQYMTDVMHCHIKDYQMPDLQTSPNTPSNHYQVIQNVTAVLQGKTSTSTNALEGMKVVAIIEQIYQKASIRVV